MRGIAIQYNDNTTQGQVLDLKSDVQIDDQGKVLSGLSFGKVTDQNVALLLIARPGEFKQFPTLGVALTDATLSDELLDYRHTIREQFSRERLQIEKLELYDLSRVNIKAKY